MALVAAEYPAVERRRCEALALDGGAGYAAACVDALLANGAVGTLLRAAAARSAVALFAFLLVGLCTSVMWGGIFNMAVEGLGKYTAVASGIFMTMVFGCAVMLAIQAQVAEMTDYMTSFWVVLFCAAYLLFYALIGSKVKK